ncbi:MAG TPA: 50S ribosomal protein L9 [Candidatus Paceibacterota bacterium]|nr:50S ribosomal protein L9 [Candidatus Paceibacterota bacterium]
MKVILLKDVGGVGQRGQVKDIADGYALNYLIPSGAAAQATPEKVAAHEAAQKKEGELKEAQQQELTEKVNSLEGGRIEISARATEKGGLFKSLGVADIQKSIQVQKNIDIPASAIGLEKPIKELGEHVVQLKTPGAQARLTVVVKESD